MAEEGTRGDEDPRGEGRRPLQVKRTPLSWDLKDLNVMHALKYVIDFEP